MPAGEEKEVRATYSMGFLEREMGQVTGGYAPHRTLPLCQESSFGIYPDSILTLTRQFYSRFPT